MSKGYARHQERMQELNSFGRDLTRRAKSKCELCETAGVKLSVYEVEPLAEEAEFERCMLICESCTDALKNIKKAPIAQMRFLENSIWSEVAIVKATAIYLLRAFADKTPWAREALDNVYIDPDTEALLKKIEL